MGWITALKIVPWSDVVAAAPTIVRGAQQLWTKVRSSAPPAEAPNAAAGSGVAVQDPQVAIEQRFLALEGRIEEHRRAAVVASELIATLAGQNAQLVEAVARLNARTRWLFGAVAVLALALLAVGVWVATR